MTRPRVAFGFALTSGALLGCPLFSGNDVRDGEFARTPPPPDEPVSISSPAQNLQFSPDGVWVFLKHASERRGAPTFADVAGRTLREMKGAPVPDALIMWPHEHGYFGIHATTISGEVVSNVVSVSLTAGPHRVWQRAVPRVMVGQDGAPRFGLAASGERLWVVAQQHLDIYRSDDGTPVASLPITFEALVDGSGALLASIEKEALTIDDANDGRKVCSASVPGKEHRAMVVDGDRVALSHGALVDVFDMHDCKALASFAVPGTAIALHGDMLVIDGGEPPQEVAHPSVGSPNPAASSGDAPNVARRVLVVASVLTHATRVVPIGSGPLVLSADASHALALSWASGSPPWPLRMADSATGVVRVIDEGGEHVDAGTSIAQRAMFSADGSVAFVATTDARVRAASPPAGAPPRGSALDAERRVPLYLLRIDVATLHTTHAELQTSGEVALAPQGVPCLALDGASSACVNPDTLETLSLEPTIAR